MALSPEDVIIIHASSRPVFEGGETVRLMNIEFTVRGFGPYSVDIPVSRKNGYES